MVLDRDLLESWREREGRNWKWVAQQLCLTPQTFYHQLAGRYGVSLKTALRLERITGIPIRSLVREEVAVNG